MPRSSQIDLAQTITHLQQQVEQLRRQPLGLNTAQRNTWERSLQELMAGIRGLQCLYQDLGEEQGGYSGLDDWQRRYGCREDLKLAQQRTRQQQLEERLQQSQAFLDQSQAVGRMGSFLWTAAEGEVIWSQGTYNLLGYDPEQHQPSLENLIRQIHPSDRDSFVANLKIALQEGDRYSCEFRIQRPDGAIVCLEVRAEIVRDQQGGAIQMIGTLLDIDERKQTEAQLRRSEVRLQTLIESFPFVVWAKDREGKVTLQNSISSQMWGHWVGHHHRPQLADDILQIWQEEERRAAAGEVVVAEDVVTFGKHQRHFFKIIAPIHNGDQIEGILAASFDITEQKRIEQALHLNQIRLQTLIDTIPMGIWARDAAGNLILQNLTDRLNYGDLIDTGREALPIPEEQKQIWSEFSERAKQGETVYYEADEIFEGNPRHFLRVIAAFPDLEGKVGTMGTALDITDRVRMEEELKQREELFRILFEQAPVGISQTDMEGRFLRINSRLCELFGYTKEEMEQLQLSNAIHPDYYETNYRHRQALFRGEISSFTLEEQIIRKDKQTRWVHVTASLIRDEQGRPLSKLAIVEDITERKQLSQRKDEFISTLSHELRTPLTSIHTLLGLLSAGHLGQLTEAGLRLLEAAKADTDRLNRMIDNLLHLDQLKAGRVHIHREFLSTDILIAQVFHTMLPLANRAQIGLDSQIEAHLAYADPDRLIQVLVNLIGNAIKFSPPKSSICLTVSQRPEGTVWQVRDQGSGVPPHRLEMIFEPFQQGSSADNRRHYGSGLGLAICAQIIRHHHGRIWAENLEIGSRFSFTLPHCPSSPPVHQG